MGQISLWQILLVAAIVVLVFGSKRLPDTARSLGKSLRILKSEAAALKTEEPQPHQPQQQAQPVQPVPQLQHPQQAPEPVHQPPVSS